MELRELVSILINLEGTTDPLRVSRAVAYRAVAAANLIRPATSPLRVLVDPERGFFSITSAPRPVKLDAALLRSGVSELPAHGVLGVSNTTYREVLRALRSHPERDHLVLTPDESTQVVYVYKRWHADGCNADHVRWLGFNNNPTDIELE